MKRQQQQHKHTLNLQPVMCDIVCPQLTAKKQIDHEIKTNFEHTHMHQVLAQFNRRTEMSLNCNAMQSKR